MQQALEKVKKYNDEYMDSIAVIHHCIGWTEVIQLEFSGNDEEK